MPLEQETFWIRWDYDAPVGQARTDYPLPLGRNVLLEGIGAGREDTTVLFRFWWIYEDNTAKRIAPRASTVANEDWLVSPTIANYRLNWREIPLSSAPMCDLQALGIEVLNSGAGVKSVEGHFRGKYVG